MNRSLLISLAGGLVAVASIFATLPESRSWYRPGWLRLSVGVAGARHRFGGDAGGGDEW